MCAVISIQKEKNPQTIDSQTAYVKAAPLSDVADLPLITDELADGNILILRITPLARKSIEDAKQVVNMLQHYIAEHGGDIARIGTDRIIITPSAVKIWRGE